MDQYQYIERNMDVSREMPESEINESVVSKPVSEGYDPATPLPESSLIQPLFSVPARKNSQEETARRSEPMQHLLEYYVDAGTEPITMPQLTAQIDTDKIAVTIPVEKIQYTDSAYTSYVYEGDFPTISVLVFIMAKHEEVYKIPPESLQVSKRFSQYISKAYSDYFKKAFDGTIPLYKNGLDIPIYFLTSMPHNEVGCIRRCDRKE